MSIEYMAVEWKTRWSADDAEFLGRLLELRQQGWEEYVREAYPVAPPPGGVVIMRRPKDEPRADVAEVVGKAECVGRLWTETELRGFIDNHLGQAYAAAPQAQMQSAIDEVVAVSKGRWAEVEGSTQEAVGKLLWPLATKEEGLVGRIAKDAQRQTLQAAIDEVVAISTMNPQRMPPFPTYDAVVRLLWPLATKEE